MSSIEVVGNTGHGCRNTEIAECAFPCGRTEDVFPRRPPGGHYKKGRCILEFRGKEIRFRRSLIRVAYLDGEGFQFLEDPEAATEELRKSRRRIDLFTFTQKLGEAPKYVYPMEWDNLATAHISGYDDWMMRQIHTKVRTKIRKAGKMGVVTREVPLDDELLRGISAIYNETPIRRGKRFWHYGIDLDSLRRMKSTFLERSIFLGAFFEGILVGFIKLVTDEHQNQAVSLHVISMIQHRDKCAMNALIAQAVRTCVERGIPYLCLAGKVGGDTHGADHLRFKLNNGFQQMDFPRYYVPLTGLGRMALGLGLHHDLASWIPEPVGVAYRRIRRLWYAMKFPSLDNA